MAINMGSVIAYLELDTSKFSKGFTSAYNDLKVFGDKSSTAEQKLKGFSSALNTVGSGLAKSVTLPLLGIGTAAVKVTSTFDSAMSEVKAISGATGTQFTQLRDKAIEMGAKTKFSATESAEAFKYMAMAGWDTKDMLNSISGVMNLAAASGEDLGTVSDIVTDAMTAFGLAADGTTKVLKNGYNVEVSNAEHFSDVLAEASSRSNTNVSLMGATFKYVAPIAGAMGYSIEDTAVAIGLMANAGIKGEQAGTALRSTITRLVKPTKESGTAMDALGISVANSDGSMKSLDDVLRQVRSSMSGLTEDQKASYAAMLAGQEGMSGLLAIVNASDEDYQKLSESIQNCTGASQEMADTMQDNLGGAVTLLKSALESAGITIGERLTPYIRGLAEWITGLVEKFNSLSDTQQDLIVKIGLVLAAIAPVMLIGSKVFSLLSSIIGIITTIGGALSTVFAFGLNNAALSAAGVSSNMITLSSVLSAITSPLSLIVVGITALAGAFITLWKTSKDFREQITGTFEQLQSVVKGFLDGIVSRINEFGFNFTSITDVIKSAWIGLCNIIVPMFTGAFKTVVDILSNVFDTILSALDVFIGVFTGDWQRVRDGVSGVFDSIIELALGFVTNVLATIGEIGANILQAFGLDGVAEGFRTFFTETIPSIIDGAINVIEGAFDGIITFFTETLPNGLNNFASVTIPQFIANVTAFFQNLPYNIGYIIGEAIGHIYLFGSNLLSWAATAIPQFIANVVAFFAQLPGAIWQWLVSAFNYVVTWGSQMISQGSSAMQSFISSVISIIRNLPSNIWSILTQIPSKVRQIGSDLKSAGSAAFKALWDGIKSVGESILDWVSDFASTITSFVSGIVDGFKNIVSGADDAKSAAASVKGSHANGLDYVPYNGYIAELHKGERVLTAQENKAYSKGVNASSTGGDTFNFYNTQPSPYEYARQMKKAKKELAYGI